MTFKWHIWLVIDSWSLTAPIRNSVRGRTEFCKITMTSDRRKLPFLTPTLLLIFDRRPLPWYSLRLPLKSKMVAIIFVEEILTTRAPKLRLLCRLTITRFCLLFFNYKWYIPFRKHQMKVTFLVMNSDWQIYQVKRLIATVSRINFEVTKKRFTKEFRAQLAISYFDIQLTWKDPENCNEIQSNLKDNS